MASRSETSSSTFSLSGGGVTGELFRSINWSKTALGPIDKWPDSLKTALQILFHSRTPMLIGWGPHFIQFYNDAYIPLLGKVMHPQAMGQKGHECWAQDWDQWKGRVESVFYHGESVVHSGHFSTHDENMFEQMSYWTQSYSPIPHADGRIGGVLVVAERVFNDEFHRMADFVPQILWTADAEGNLNYYNQRWYDFVERTFDETKGWGWDTVLHPDDLEPTIKRWREACLTGGPYTAEYRIRRASDGMYRWHLGRAIADLDANGKPIKWYGTDTDVHDQKMAHENLALLTESVRRIQARYEIVTRATRNAIWDWDLATNEVEWNEALSTELGHPASALSSTRDWWAEHIHPEDREEILHKIHQLIDSGGEFWKGEYRFLKGDGTYGLFRDRGYVIHDSQGQAIRMMGAMEDVTNERSVAAQLRDSEEKFRALAEVTPQMLFIADPQGRISYFNQRFIDYVGIPLDKLNNWKWQNSSLHHPDDLKRTLMRWNESLKTGKPYETEYRLRRKDGQYRWHLGRAVPVKDAAGTIVSWFGTNTDIHDQRLLAEQLSVAVSAANLGFWDFSIPTRRVTWNEQLRQHYGFPKDKFEGDLSEVLERIHPGDRESVLEALAEAQTQLKPYHLEFRVLPDLNSPHQVRWLECQGQTYSNESGQPVRVTGTSLDITERVVAAQQLRDAKNVAESASAAKSQFLANMSHEIRTPLGAIMGFVSLLKDEHLSRQDQLGYISVVERNSTQLLRIIDDILDLSKVEAGMMLIEHIEFSLVELLADFSSLMGFKAHEKGIGFFLKATSPLPKMIVSDPTRLRQILSNIMGNAIKFTDKGRVDMAVDCKNGQLEFVVKDTGRGIGAEQLPHLFKPFAQADTSITRQYGGTGLGLVLTRRLSEALGGNFSLKESELGRGSTFVARIKVEVPPQTEMVHELGFTTEAQRLPVAKGQLSGFKILLVEDSPDNQALITIFLRRAGACVDLASDGLQGSQMAFQDSYDVVLMDIQMPVMDGIAAVKKLRAEGYRRPIVALTAHAMKEERIRCLQAGFTDFLSKPVDKTDLIELIAKLKRSPPKTKIKKDKQPTV